MACPFLPPISNPVVPVDLDSDPLLAQQWLLEAWFVRVRWWSLPVCLLALPFFPAAPWPVRLLLPTCLGLGNAWLGHLLRWTPTRSGLRSVRRSATGLDWLLGLGGLGLSAGAVAHQALPAVLLLLVLATGLRYDLCGLLIAACGSTVFTTLVVGMHIVVFRALTWRQAAGLLAGWELLTVLTVLLGDATLQARRAWTRWEQHRPGAELSPRERTLLRLLAQEDLTYAAIASQLHISEETVKTHVHNLGVKLGVSRRWRVVGEARRRGLLPGQDPGSPR